MAILGQLENPQKSDQILIDDVKIVGKDLFIGHF